MNKRQISGVVIKSELINPSLTFLTIDPIEVDLMSMRVPIFDGLPKSLDGKVVDFTETLQDQSLIQEVIGSDFGYVINIPIKMYMGFFKNI